MEQLTHLDERGRARMVDVGAKPETERVAVARGRVRLQPATLALIRSGEVAKGDVLAVARVAGIMAAKRTGDLIPLCHPLPITAVEVDITPDEAASTLEIEATARIVGRTGVEMEALTAVSVAALTIYDMCKAVDRGMTIEAVRLVHKRGGRSGEYWREEEMAGEQPRASAPREGHMEQGGRRISVAVVTISDSAARGEREEDLSGQAVRDNVHHFGGVVEHYEIIPDEQEMIAETLKILADDGRYDVILTTGGTGLGPRDRTPQATKEVIDYDVPGLAELMRAESAKRAKFAYLSRAVVGVRGETLIANLPGSPKGCAETVEILAPYLPHAVQVLRGEVREHKPS